MPILKRKDLRPQEFSGRQLAPEFSAPVFESNVLPPKMLPLSEVAGGLSLPSTRFRAWRGEGTLCPSLAWKVVGGETGPSRGDGLAVTLPVSLAEE